MRIINFLNPGRLVFGKGCITHCADDILSRNLKSVFIVTADPVVQLADPLVGALNKGGATTTIFSEVNSEPTVGMFRETLQAAQIAMPDAVVGLGGGSPLDVAKLVAALLDSGQSVEDVFGIGLIKNRNTYLACVPTTSGTGSEVSPNAILLDEKEGLKKGAVSPFLVPDGAFVDPMLTISVPPAVTASTGLDAMVHCIEAYANKFAHPTVDIYAIEGVRLIAANLKCAVDNGHDVEARTALSLGSLYGGLCLGPVNTAAVHALAYPLGGEFKIAHGVSNSVLLPHVIEYNIESAIDRYADIALALGIEKGHSTEETANRGLHRMKELSRQCGIPQHIGDLGVPSEAIPKLAASAMTVTRLLKNNPREMTEEAACAIYKAAY